MKLRWFTRAPPDSSHPSIISRYALASGSFRINRGLAPSG